MLGFHSTRVAHLVGIGVTQMPTEQEPPLIPKQVRVADFSRLDVERICRVLIRIATHLEEKTHEELSTQGQGQQQAAAGNGMGTN